jgi:hypothetical protein
MTKYSDKEIKLIKHFGFEHLINTDSIVAPTLYRMMAEKAFLDAEEGLYAQSLRRCIIAFNTGSVFRNTPEWDKLIEV